MNFYMLLVMFSYLLFIWALLVLIFLRRKKAVADGKVDYKYFKTYRSSAEVPEELLKIANNVNNQFQVPMIFLITGTLFIALKVVTPISLGLAILFVIFRIGHSVIHIGSNQPLKRAYWYMGGWFMLFAMWIHLLILNF